MTDRLAGSTDVTIYMHLRLLADGTDATAPSGPITLQYVRTRSTPVSQSIATLAAADSAHADFSGIHVGKGVWRFDLPDAAFAVNVPEVVITAEHPDIFTESLTVPLVAYNPLDAVRLGITALPNAAAEAAGGLYTRGTGAGQINQDAAGRIDTHPVALADNVITAASIATDAGTELGTAVWASAARTLTSLDEDNTTIDIDSTVRNAVGLSSANLDVQLAALATLIGDVPTVGEFDTAIATLATAASIAALNNLSQAQVQAAVAAALAVTRAEPGQGNPGATVNPLLKIDYLYQWARNRKTVTATEVNMYADNGTTIAQKATHSDDGTTYDRGELATGA